MFLKYKLDDLGEERQVPASKWKLSTSMTLWTILCNGNVSDNIIIQTHPKTHSNLVSQ